MSKHDEIARDRSWRERQTQLASPDFYVSPTRIVLRNLPLKMGNDGLRRLCDNAVRARATRQVPDILSAHMIFDKERRNPDGTPRSRGIGFVEFSEHEHALTALRHLNNNPEIYGADRRPIVEFSVENVKMKKRMEAKRRRKAESRAPADGAKGRGGAAAVDGAARGRAGAKRPRAPEGEGAAEAGGGRRRGEDGPPMSKSKKRRENRKKHEANRLRPARE